MTQYVMLNNGSRIPTIGLGVECFQPNNAKKTQLQTLDILLDITRQSKPGEVGAAVEAALKAGYKLVDCAHIYGNEEEVGASLRKCFDKGVVKREDIFITSKLWNSDHENVQAACELTLKNLGLDYLDLYLIHWPCPLKPGTTLSNFTYEGRKKYTIEGIAHTWQSMEDLVSQGLVKAIGISNFTITKTENLLKTAKIVPAVNQVECHPYFQQQKLKKYCISKGIVFEAYSPLGTPGRPVWNDNDPLVLLKDISIKEIADKHDSTPAQICIAFALYRGLVVIPKTVNPTRVVENLKSTEIQLDAKDIRKLQQLDMHRRMLNGAIFFVKNQTEAEFWDDKLDAKFELTEQAVEDES